MTDFTFIVGWILAPGTGRSSSNDDIPNFSKFLDTAPRTSGDHLNDVRTGEMENEGHNERSRFEPIRLHIHTRQSSRDELKPSVKSSLEVDDPWCLPLDVDTLYIQIPQVHRPLIHNNTPFVLIQVNPDLLAHFARIKLEPFLLRTHPVVPSIRNGAGSR